MVAIPTITAIARKIAPITLCVRLGTAASLGKTYPGIECFDVDEPTNSRRAASMLALSTRFVSTTRRPAVVMRLYR